MGIEAHSYAEMNLSHPMEAARDDWDTCFDKDAMLLLPLTTEFDALLLWLWLWPAAAWLP